MRVVFDTNVVVSAMMLLGSPPRRAFDAALQHGQSLVSEAMLEELDDVLRRPKLAEYASEEQRLEFLAAYIRDAEDVLATTRLRDAVIPRTTSSLNWQSQERLLTSSREIRIS